MRWRLYQGEGVHRWYHAMDIHRANKKQKHSGITEQTSTLSGWLLLFSRQEIVVWFQDQNTRFVIMILLRKTCHLLEWRVRHILDNQTHFGWSACDIHQGVHFADTLLMHRCSVEMKYAVLTLTRRTSYE